eukprot:TRINITY_DN10162_c1_g2_i1.p1 TRINITY_DN10162_c1_g2~~TRINITY_DN10162_c1_g2_i1.p1  ORF type:complete len:1143 (+),score=377.01 TRINITY_DN10162_c1_g2_i1:126-3431(+)
MPRLLSAWRKRPGKMDADGLLRQDSASPDRVSPLGSMASFKSLRRPFRRQRRGSEEESDDQDASPLALRFFSNRFDRSKGGENPEDNEAEAIERLRGQFRAWQADREKHKEEELEFARKLKEKQRLIERSHLEEEVSILAILQYLCKDVRKTRLYRSLPWYIVFMVVLTTNMSLSRFESRNSQLYFRNLAMKRMLLADEHAEGGQGAFLGIQSEQQFWAWLRGTARDPLVEGAADRLWGATVNTHNAPVAFLLLRQWRVRQGSCDTKGGLLPVAPSERLRLPTQCYGHYSSDMRSDAPYGTATAAQPTTPKYFPQGQINGAVSSVAVEGIMDEYSDLSSAFPIYLLFGSPKAQVDAQLQDMENSGWIDQQTRAIAVEMLTYNQPEAVVVFTELIIEVTEAGVWLANVRSRPFAILNFQEATGIAIFVLDCMILLWIVKDIVFLVIFIRRERQLTLTGFYTVGGWNIFYAVIQAAAVTLYYYRVQLWLRGLSINDTFFQDNVGDYAVNPNLPAPELRLMYQTLAEYSVTYTKSFNVVSVLLPMCWMRIFSFVQYNERLNALTETAKMALSPLISLAIIFCIVLLGFTMGGHILYGYDMHEFQNIIRTAGYLLRVLVSGEIDDYDGYRRIHPAWTACYFLFWFILGWVLILNVVLAIIAGSYAMVQDMNTKTLSWDLATVFKAARHWWLKMRNKAVPKEGGSGGEDPALASRAEEGFNEDYLTARVKAIEILKKVFVEDVSSPEYITHARLAELLGGTNAVMSQSTIASLYKKASLEVSAGHHTIRVGERWAEQMKVRLRVMEQQLARMLASQHNVEKISSIKEAVAALAKKAEQNQQSVADVSKRAGNMSRDLDRVTTLAADSHRILESQLLTEVRRMQSGLAGLEGTNRDAVNEMAKQVGANILQLRERVDSANKKMTKASHKPAAGGWGAEWGAEWGGWEYDAAGNCVPVGMGQDWGAANPLAAPAAPPSPKRSGGRQRSKRSRCSPPKRRRGDRGKGSPRKDKKARPRRGDSASGGESVSFLSPSEGWDSDDPPSPGADAAPPPAPGREGLPAAPPPAAAGGSRGAAAPRRAASSPPRAGRPHGGGGTRRDGRPAALPT